MRTMEITTRIGCSNMCAFCPQKLFVGEYRKQSTDYVLTLETYRKCLSKIPKDVHITFAGMVEPWLNRDMTEMLLYTHNQGYTYVGVFTTCVGLKLEDVKKIKDIPYEMFVIHLADADRNAKIPVTPESIQVLKALKKANIKNISYMTMGTLHPKLVPLFGDVCESKKMLSRAGTVDGINTVQNKGAIMCNSDAGIKHNVLMPNGDVYLCCMDYGLKHRLGNLISGTYENLFKGTEFISIQKKLKDEKNGEVICRSCEYAMPDTYKKYLRPLKKKIISLLGK
jgi:radical SAM protein with 4Fe4S-binding SPASM domain